MTKDYEAIGRYHAYSDEAKALADQRNRLLSRLRGMITALDTPLMDRTRLARRFNFAAAQNLFAEAQATDEQLRAKLQQIAELAPVADLPPLELE